MDTAFFIKGLILGFSIAAPVGPIGVLCIQRTLSFGKKSGLLTGLGAATADGIYGVIAAFGLTAISSFLVGQQFWFRLIGGLFLLYLGVKTFVTKPAGKSATINHKGLFSDYSSAILLTITNPVTILSFIAVFAGLGLGNSSGNLLSAIMLILGVFAGSVLWWIILSSSAGLLKPKSNTSTLKIINKLSGTVIIVFAILAFVSIFEK